MTKPATKPAARPKQQTGALAAVLLTGSVIATLAGTRLLSFQDVGQPATAVNPTAATTIMVPAAETSTIALPPTGRGVQIELPPIPQAVQPQIQPVARTRSSQ